MFAGVRNFLNSSPYGLLIIILGIALAALLFVLPLVRKLRRKRLKSKETKDIMKDLLTWRHLAQLVKGGDEHNKAKQELSDNIVRINELLKQGFDHAARNIQNLYSIPWYVILGEPRSGKSAFLAASELELAPSAEEDNPQEDPKASLPVRFWTGAKAVVCDISGKVFFDRWLEASSAEWAYIVKQICRKRRRRVLDGVILTIPADALLADDDNLSSKKAILMANELGKLLQQSGMRLPCYAAVTKLDMVSGFQEYAGALTGDLRRQILGFESDSPLFNEDAFRRFWETCYERLRSGAKQLLFPGPLDGEAGGSSRMDRGGKIWLFPDNFAGLYKNLKVYLEILFGENNFHGTKNTFFEGVFFTSAKDLGFSFSPAVAALAGRDTDSVLIPAVKTAEDDRNAPEAPAAASSVQDSGSTALVAVNAGRTLIVPYLRKADLLRGYFIRDLLHRRIFVPSLHADFVPREALRRHVPHYLLCAAMTGLGILWLSAAVLRAGELRVSLIQAESYYQWLDSVLQKGGHLRSPLITEDSSRGFVLNREPVEGESLSSRLQFYYDAQIYRDLKIPAPLGFKLSEALVFRFDRNMGCRDKAFIANQLHKAMVRIPVIKSTGRRLTEQVDVQVLDLETRGVIASFVSLDKAQGVDLYAFFTAPGFRLDSMIRYLIPDISNDSMELLNRYMPRYDRPHTLQMDVDYLYSADYQAAKQAGIDTVLSAWRRRAVYPDSIYGKLRSLASISGDIAANYTDITGALGRISGVSAIAGVEEAVYEWKRLTDRHKRLAAQGRSLFEEVRLLMRAAHIPLSFEHSLLPVSPAPASGGQGGTPGLPALQRRPPLDAFGNNLINDYLFNDMVIGYAVKEYTRLFEADMEFVKGEAGNSGNSTLGQILSEQNTFTSGLNREVMELRTRAGVLRNNEFLSQRISEKPDDPSFFMTLERIIALASDIPVPRQESLEQAGFEASWEQGQSNIQTAMDAFESFVKPYADSEKLAPLIAGARIMLLAQAYYNRYVIFTTSLAFLNTFEGNIAAVIEAKSSGKDLFSFSGSAIAGLFGGFYSQRGYDPVQVKAILDDIASFASLFAAGEDAKALPLFLRHADPGIYRPPAFMDYLASYIAYWGNYPDRVYVSPGAWDRFLARAREYKSFQINSALLSIYTKSLEWLNQIDPSLLNESLLALKSGYVTSLGDKLALLNQFLSADAERMFSSWARLSPDPLEAYNTLRGISEEDLKSSYLTVYTGTGEDAVSIGWWNSFVLDGASILARHADRVNMARLIENARRYKAYPLCGDASPSNALSLDAVRELASLLEALGAGLPAEGEKDPFKAALRHSLFQGSAVQAWADTICRIAGALGDAQKPLGWTLYQAPVEVQTRLTGKGRLLAVDRFRYLDASRGGSSPRMSSTYMNEKLNILEGNPPDGDLILRFYKTSRDRTPGAIAAVNRPWAIFDLYLQRDAAGDSQGGRYIPVYLEDEAGQYVYYLAVEFEPELPAPASWYWSANWPDLMISQGMITERR
jgi:hypothetical protein